RSPSPCTAKNIPGHERSSPAIAGGSPWTLVLHIDGPDDLAQILLGRLGGEHVRTLPWVRKPTASVEVRSARIEFGDGDVRVGGAIRLRATTPFETDSTVSCIVPGHRADQRQGRRRRPAIRVRAPRHVRLHARIRTPANAYISGLSSVAIAVPMQTARVRAIEMKQLWNRGDATDGKRWARRTRKTA
ncbi:MAG: hypothetical protein M3P01_13020, partial [Actinomycetota bacterium]|nr:hypothetical protein [Actinomycetota bacterium]